MCRQARPTGRSLGGRPWLALAGLLPACGTVAGGPPDAAGTDAAAVADGPVGVADAASAADARPLLDAPAAAPRVLIPSFFDDELYVYQTGPLAALAPAPLPDRDGTGSRGIAGAGDRVYVTSIAHVTALDAVTLELLPGAPQQVTTCDPAAALFSGAALFCPAGGAGMVYRFEGDPFSPVDSAALASPQVTAGTLRRLLVPYGPDDTTIAVLDGATLDPLAGSPIAVPSLPIVLAADDETDRIAAGAANVLYLYDATSLILIGSVTYPVDTGVSGLAFEPASGRLFAGLGRGKVALYDAGDLSELVAPIARALTNQGVWYPQFDAGLVYAVASAFGGEARLIVLDAATLDHAIGSPLILPGAAAGLAVVR